MPATATSSSNSLTMRLYTAPDHRVVGAVATDTEPVDDRRERGPSPRERRYAENAAPAAEEVPDTPEADDEVAADADTEAPASTESELDAPPAAVAQADEVDPNQMSLFDELDGGEGEGR